MKKLRKKSIVIVLLIFILLILANCKVLAKDTKYILQKQEYSENYKRWLELSEDERKKVLMPRMYDVPYNKIENTNPLYNARSLKASLASRYSLKDIIPENLKIRNQQQTNTCWAFARLSSLETNLALSNYKKGVNVSKVYDYSERHMEYATSRYFANDEENPLGYNRRVGDGGNYILADTYLANGYGAIPEEEMPFENNEDLIDINQIKNKTISTQLYDTIEFPDYNKETGENREEIINQVKQHIQNYGSVYAPLHGASESTSSYSCYNEATAAKFCNNEVMHMADHAVSIIGWDDNYSVENFNENARPTSNGAWIARNSWGEKNPIGTIAELKVIIFEQYRDECIQNGWNTAEEIPDSFIKEFATEVGWIIEGDTIYQKYGDEGFIYISYEDVNVSSQMCGIVKAADTVNYEEIYNYDELGPGQLIALNTPKIMLSNIFDKKTTQTEYLTQVSLFVFDKCTCKVYVNPNGTSNKKSDLELVQLQEGETETFGAGYHTLEFAEPVEIKGDSFTVVLEIQSDANLTPFAVEGKQPNVPNDPFLNAKIETGKCFLGIGNNLDNCEWFDLGKLSQSELGARITRWR